MFYKDAQFAWDLYSISPELTCTCKKKTKQTLKTQNHEWRN